MDKVSRYSSSKETAEEEVFECSKCSNHWLELIEVGRFQKYHSVIVGQKPPKKTPQGFFLLRCPKCSNIMEPNVSLGGRDLGQTEYRKAMDSVLSPLPTLKIDKL